MKQIRLYADHIGEKCPVCGDVFSFDLANCAPCWSDHHDNIVCWDCKNTAIKEGEN